MIKCKSGACVAPAIYALYLLKHGRRSAHASIRKTNHNLHICCDCCPNKGLRPRHIILTLYMKVGLVLCLRSYWHEPNGSWTIRMLHLASGTAAPDSEITDVLDLLSIGRLCTLLYQCMATSWQPFLYHHAKTLVQIFLWKSICYHKGRALDFFLHSWEIPKTPFREMLNPMRPCRILWLSTCQNWISGPFTYTSEPPQKNIGTKWLLFSIQGNETTVWFNAQFLQQLLISILSNPLKLEDSLYHEATIGTIGIRVLDVTFCGFPQYHTTHQEF